MNLKLYPSDYETNRAEQEILRDYNLSIPNLPQQVMDSVPSYHPTETPMSRREPQITRTEQPITRYRARILSQNYLDQ